PVRQDLRDLHAIPSGKRGVIRLTHRENRVVLNALPHEKALRQGRLVETIHRRRGRPVQPALLGLVEAVDNGGCTRNRLTASRNLAEGGGVVQFGTVKVELGVRGVQGAGQVENTTVRVVSRVGVQLVCRRVRKVSNRILTSQVETVNKVALKPLKGHT